MEAGLLALNEFGLVLCPDSIFVLGATAVSAVRSDVDSVLIPL